MDKKEILKIVENEASYIQEFILVRPFEQSVTAVMELIADKYPLVAEDIFEHDETSVLYTVQPAKNYQMYFADFKHDIGNTIPVYIDKIQVEMAIHHNWDYLEPEPESETA